MTDKLTEAQIDELLKGSKYEIKTCRGDDGWHHVNDAPMLLAQDAKINAARVVQLERDVARLKAGNEWQSIETAPKDGRIVDLYMPKYSMHVAAHWHESELFAAAWVHESGWRPDNSEEYANKQLYSHWRPHDESAPEGYIHRAWNADKQEFAYGKNAEAIRQAAAEER